MLHIQLSHDIDIVLKATMIRPAFLVPLFLTPLSEQLCLRLSLVLK